MKHLGLWLDNPPFKSNNVALKRETFLQILNFIGVLSPEQVDKQLTTVLDIKQAITLSKYIFKAFEQIDKGDEGKIRIYSHLMKMLRKEFNSRHCSRFNSKSRRSMASALF